MLYQMTAGYVPTTGESSIGNNVVLGTAASKTTFTSEV